MGAENIFQFKNQIVDFFSNRVLLCAIFSWLAAQIIKIFTTKKKRENFSILDLLVGSGGMPSSHSAVVCATCMSCGIIHGFNSAIFAVSAVLAIVVMRDASGVRRESGKQAEVINQISSELTKKHKNFSQITLSEMVGHTPLQVFFGALLGVTMAYFCQYFLFVRIFGV